MDSETNSYLIQVLYHLIKNRNELIDIFLHNGNEKNKNYKKFLELSFVKNDETTLNDKNNKIHINIYEKETIKNLINKLPKYQKVKSNLDEECSICLEKYSEKTYKRTLECNHHFHKKCIDKWLKKCDEENIHCPICRNRYEYKVNKIYSCNLDIDIEI